MSGRSNGAVGGKIAGIGRICFWQGGSVWLGRDVGRARPHSHHAIQISLALDGSAAFLLRGAADRRWSAHEAAIVMPHRRHEFDGQGSSIAQIFVEPESESGRALTARFAAADIRKLPGEDLRAAADLRLSSAASGANDPALVAASQRVIDSLIGSLPERPRASPRVAAAIEFISRRMASGVALDDVAAAVHLSASRLRHVFAQETGTTYRGYVLWLRIQRAVAAMMEGRTWTEAAHEAGFADSAHLSRTFRRTFGVSPAMIVKE